MKSYQTILDEVKATMNLGSAPVKADYTVYFAYKAGEVKQCSTKAEALAFSSNVEAHTFDYDAVLRQYRKDTISAQRTAGQIMMAQFIDSHPGLTEDLANKLADIAITIMNDTDGLTVDSTGWFYDTQFDIMNTLWVRGFRDLQASN